MKIKLDDKFLKPYNPGETEEKNYDIWEKSGFFNPDECIKKGVTETDAPAFSIVLPPPNVTGTLHIGHAEMLAIEDIMVRFARMNGKKTLWLPGTDHASIATQSKVEKNIYKEEGKSRYDIGREEMLKRIDKFAKESHDTIISQIKKMGSSIDWSREAFTLDEKRNRAVRRAFKKMYDDGLIYRKNRVINWDPKGQTTISDDEIVYETRKAKLYTFKYDKDFPIAISTTRPETKFGDVAVAVHPDDERYKKFINNEYSVNFCGEKLNIKIIADEGVDKDFGTGALGVTPAHSKIDWEMAEKNFLPVKQVINEYGKMIIGPENINGKKTAEAGKLVAEWLKNEGLLMKEDEIDQNVATAERTGAIIEPIPKLQWFIAVDKKFIYKGKDIDGLTSGSEQTLKSLMLHVVKSNQIKILPDRFEKVYYHWIENLKDWCISRQIWYGHRIPVWYKNDNEIFCGEEKPDGAEWKQDEDTLDTWFSSGLWTFSTLGWPDNWDESNFKAIKGTDLAVFHPTSIIETGYDILFFWVARMILMSGYLIGQIPFKTVYLHGLVRDAQGRKMSKSLGNIINPVDLINKYGADAVRLALIIGTGPGNDLKMSEDKVKGYKHFANKIWNITRFILTYSEGIEYSPAYNKYSDEELKMIAERNSLITEITKEMAENKFYLVGEKLYQYIWYRFADQILEESKKIESESRKYFLIDTLIMILKVIHPFMPFVTEEIWKSIEIENKPQYLMIADWPNLN